MIANVCNTSARVYLKYVSKIACITWKLEIDMKFLTLAEATAKATKDYEKEMFQSIVDLRGSECQGCGGDCGTTEKPEIFFDANCITLGYCGDCKNQEYILEVAEYEGITISDAQASEIYSHMQENDIQIEALQVAQELDKYSEEGGIQPLECSAIIEEDELTMLFAVIQDGKPRIAHTVFGWESDDPKDLREEAHITTDVKFKKGSELLKLLDITDSEDWECMSKEYSKNGLCTLMFKNKLQEK